MSTFPFICCVKASNLFLKEFMFRCPRTSLLKLRLRRDFKLLSPSNTLVLYSSVTNLPLFLLLFRLWKMNCHWIEFEIASVKLLDRIVVPLLFRCNLDPFKCLSVIVFSWFINSNFFSWYNLFKLRFTCATLFRCLSFLTVMPEIATLHESDGNVEAFFLFI